MWTARRMANPALVQYDRFEYLTQNDRYFKLLILSKILLLRTSNPDG